MWPQLAASGDWSQLLGAAAARASRLRGAGHESRRRASGSGSRVAAWGLPARLMLGPRPAGGSLLPGLVGPLPAESGPLSDRGGAGFHRNGNRPRPQWGDPRRGGERGSPYGPAPGGAEPGPSSSKAYAHQGQVTNQSRAEGADYGTNPMLPDVGPLRRESEGKLFVHSLTWARGPSRPRPAAPGGPRPADSASAILGRRRPGLRRIGRWLPGTPATSPDVATAGHRQLTSHPRAGRWGIERPGQAQCHDAQAEAGTASRELKPRPAS